MKNVPEEQHEANVQEMMKSLPERLTVDKQASMCGTGGIWGSLASENQSMDSSIGAILSGNVQATTAGGGSTKAEKGATSEQPDAAPASSANANGSGNPKPSARVDLPSMKNTAYALQQRNMDATAKKMKTVLQEGQEALTISKSEDADFIKETFQRMSIGWAWLGATLSAVKPDMTEVKTLDMESHEGYASLMDRHEKNLVTLMAHHYPLVSNKEDLLPWSRMQEHLAKIKDAKDKRGSRSLWTASPGTRTWPMSCKLRSVWR